MIFFDVLNLLSPQPYFSTESRRPKKHRRELSLESIKTIQLVAEQVVLAADQTFLTCGRVKKTIAMDVVRGLLADAGIEVEDELIDIAIEAALLTLRSRTHHNIGLHPYPPPAPEKTPEKEVDGPVGAHPSQHHQSQKRKEEKQCQHHSTQAS